jgi:hypothetical protein
MGPELNKKWLGSWNIIFIKRVPFFFKNP